jgi:hypothetical protein
MEFRDLGTARADAEEAVRQTIIEKKATSEPIEMDSLQITDRAGRTLAVVDFDDDLAPGTSTPTRQ